MSKRDYYEVLGVAKTASEAEMKVRLPQARDEHHPDRNPGDKDAEIKFKELNEAYQILSGRRRSAPPTTASAMRPSRMAARAAPGFGNDFADFMSDIFDNIFGELRRRPAGPGAGGRERGADLRYNLEITLEEAFDGKTGDDQDPDLRHLRGLLRLRRQAGLEAATCPTCGGHGRVRATQGFFSIERTCPNCHGRGEVIDDPCADCGGAGRVTRERTLSVNIPAGVEDGTRIRLAGEGEAGLRGGPAGDLYIFLSIKPHAFFQRDGADLFCRVPISMVTAALGGEIDRADDRRRADAKVKVPEGTQTGKQFRLKGKGMPVLRSRDVGDLYIQVVVETPQEPDQAPARASGGVRPGLPRRRPTRRAPGFFSAVREFFDGLSGSTWA